MRAEDELTMLRALRNLGCVTDSEFETEKRKILAASKPPVVIELRAVTDWTFD